MDGGRPAVGADRQTLQAILWCFTSKEGGVGGDFIQESDVFHMSSYSGDGKIKLPAINYIL